MIFPLFALALAIAFSAHSYYCTCSYCTYSSPFCSKVNCMAGSLPNNDFVDRLGQPAIQCRAAMFDNPTIFNPAAQIHKYQMLDRYHTCVWKNLSVWQKSTGNFDSFCTLRKIFKVFSLFFLISYSFVIGSFKVLKEVGQGIEI